ncbi:MAG: hypothetical protein AAF849_04950 [Bacteroidota bacterium]
MIENIHIDDTKRIGEFVKTMILSEYTSVRSFCRAHRFTNSMMSDFLNGNKMIRLDTLFSILDALEAKAVFTIKKESLEINYSKDTE